MVVARVFHLVRLRNWRKIRSFDRQALHAVMLRFEHPVTGEQLEFHADVPDDMVEMAEALRQDTQEHGLEEDY